MIPFLTLLALLLTAPAQADMAVFTAQMVCQPGECHADLPDFETMVKYTDDQGNPKGGWAPNGLNAGGPTVIVVIQAPTATINMMKLDENKYVWIEDIAEVTNETPAP